MKKHNGNILLTFILLLGISAVLLSFLYMVTARTSNSAYMMNKTKALYIAEAGMNKAIWYLSFGAMGSAYRTTGSIESFAGGQYNYSIIDGPSGSIIITSTGEVNGTSRALQQMMTSSALPPAFNYAVFGNGNIILKGSSSVKGPLFSNGNISVQKDSNHPTGETYVSPGHTSNKPYIVVDPPPPAPTINTSYYDGLISDAGKITPGNRTITSMNLNGETILVNGDVTISGTTNLTGGGIIVATGKVNISGTTTIAPNTKIIANNMITLSDTTNLQDNGLLYSNISISDSGQNRLKGAIMAPSISFSGNDTVYGFLYSWGVSVALNGTIKVYGAIVNPSTATYEGNISIEFDSSYLPGAPIGLSSGGYSLVKGTWKEL